MVTLIKSIDLHLNLASLIETVPIINLTYFLNSNTLAYKIQQRYMYLLSDCVIVCA